MQEQRHNSWRWINFHWIEVSLTPDTMKMCTLCPRRKRRCTKMSFIIYLNSTIFQHSIGEIKNSREVLCCCSNYDLILNQNWGSTKLVLFEERRGDPSRFFEQYPFLSLFKQKYYWTIPFIQRVGQPGQQNFDCDTIIVSVFLFNHNHVVSFLSFTTIT
jgi:hypothetical protein